MTDDKRGARRPADRGNPSKASDVSESSAPVHVRFDAFELDEINARLMRDGQPLPVAPTPFALLCALVRQSGSLITKGALLDAVWGHRYVSDSVLKTAISELRTALGDDARRPRYIETVSRRGYRFIGRANATPHAQPAAAQDTTIAHGLIGRGDALSRLQSAWALASAGKRIISWVAGDPGVGKTTLVDHFVAHLHDVSIGRGQCVEQYGTRRTLLADPRRARRALPGGPYRFRATAHRGAVLAPAAALADDGRGARDVAPRAGGRAAGSHAARIGRVLRSLHRTATARARDRRPALERSRDDSADGLHRATARTRAAHVARDVSARRGRCPGSSSQGRAQRAAVAWALRRSRARSILGRGGRRLHRAARTLTGRD